MAMMMIPEGAFLTISTGEYSDYCVRGVFRALKNIDAEALRDQWLSDHPEQQTDYKFDESAFLGWVARQGLLESIDSFEWHLSDYSHAKEMYVTQAGNEDGRH